MEKIKEVIVRIKVLEEYTGARTEELLVPPLYEWVSVYWEKMTKHSDGYWYFNYVSWHSDIMLELCELANGISTNFQIALLYANHEVELIRRVAHALLKHGKKGVNIKYGKVEYDPTRNYNSIVLGNPS